MALYQFRLTRLKGRMAVKRSVPRRFMVMPDFQANGSQTSEQARCQKLFRVLSRLMKSSMRLYSDRLGTGQCGRRWAHGWLAVGRSHHGVSGDWQAIDAVASGDASYALQPPGGNPSRGPNGVKK